MFAYGTLLLPQIISRVIGRVPPAAEALLRGYRRVTVKGEVFPAVYCDPAAEVKGQVYRGIDERELQLLDHYEGDLYRRESVQIVVLGRPEWTECYVLRAGNEAHLSSEPWDLERFVALHAKTYTWE
jgi:gamma-glutamylcyclotransferase (GGCT)/AIG2-like uncharacterized protein YtfP